jgi:4'-phosphopantetheinyl transferase
MSVTVWWASPRHARLWHESLLAPAERHRADAFHRAQDRDRFVAANALLRLAVADRLGRPAGIDRACRTCGKPHGKPAVVGAPGLEVSVSHSGDWIAVAITELGPVGVDVEEVKPSTDLSSMFSYVFSPAELDALQDPGEHFYQAWTRKESVLKATGDGLRTRMSTLTVLPESETHNIRDLAPRPGYAAAVTVLTAEPLTVVERDGSTLLTAPTRPPAQPVPPAAG